MLSMAMWLPILSVLAIYVTRLSELRTKRDTVPGAIPERTTFRLFMLAGTLTLIGSIVEFCWRREGLHWDTFSAGWACAAGSFIIRRRAIAALGKFWSLHAEIRESHQFVQTGPFRWMRHPTYFSMILELLSCALILNVYYPLLAASLIFIPTLFRRIKMEEAALVEKFGDAYQQYRRTTPALFPYKLPQTR